MTWLLWRQHRLQAAVSAVCLAILGLLLATTGVHMAHLYRDAVTHCRDCLYVGSLFQGYGAVIDIVNVTIAVPVVIGTVFGSILISRETEQATHVLVWAQGVTRRHWLLAKTGFALAASVMVAGATTALVTWWSRTPNSLYHNRFDPLKFDTQNLMPIAFAVLALGIGVAAGAVLRRPLPAIAVTVGAFLACRLPTEIWLRPHYQTAVSAISQLGGPGVSPVGAWVLDGTLLDPRGHAVIGPFDPASVCPSSFNRSSAADCLNRLGYHLKTTFQPAARYWHFQWIEAGLFVAVGVVLLAVGVLITLRRDA